MTDWSDPMPVDAPARRRPRRTWPQRLLIALGLMLTVSMVAAAAGLAWGLQRYRDIKFLSVPNVEAAPPGVPSNWLLVGSDSREGIDPNDPNAGIFIGEAVEGKRTDTIIVARVDPDTRSIDLLSVPRDLWVPIAGTGQNGRINSAFNGDGGEERLVSTVENFLGIEINNYAEINFVGFQAVIDAIGGVSIWFDTPVRDPGSALDITTAGCHTLDGFEALAFARSRSLEYLDGDQWRTDPTGDLGRTSRQQFLLSRLADTARDELDLTDFTTVDQILRVGGQNLVIDDGAGAGDLIGLARTFAAVGGDGIRRHGLPVEGFRTSGGAAVLDLLEDQAGPTLDIFRGLVPPPAPAAPVAGPEPEQDLAAPAAEAVDPASFAVEVRNGGQVEGLAGDTAEALRAAGFVVDGLANAEAIDETVVAYPSHLEGAAVTVGAALTTAPRYEVDESLAVVTITLGRDYAPPAPAAQAAPADDDVVGIVPSVPPPGAVCS